jgi:hypothetical protein
LKIVSNWTHKIWSFIVLLDSTLPKDSNGISFVIFGPTERKLWILQDLNKIWFENLIRNRFKSGKATWSSAIGAYRFGRIVVLKRWILSDLDGSDWPYRFVLSGSVRSTGSRSDGTYSRRRSSPRFPARFAGEACRWRAPAVFLRLLSDGEAMTGNNSTRGARELDRLLWLLPYVSVRGGWRRGGRRWAPVDRGIDDSLDQWARQGHEDVRQVKIWSRGSERECGVPETRRNRWKGAAVMVDPGDLFWGSLAAWRRKTRGEMERKNRASYRRGSGRKRPGIYSNWKGEGNSELGLSHRRKKWLGREMIGGSHLSARGREKEGYRFGYK